MKNWLSIWLVLVITYFVGRIVASQVAAGYVGFNWEWWAHLALVPLFQALMFMLLERALSEQPTFWLISFRTLRCHPLLVGLLMGDGFFLVATWLAWDTNWVRLQHPAYLAHYYVASKSLVLGVLATRARSGRLLVSKLPLGLPMLGILWVGLGSIQFVTGTVSIVLYGICLDVAIVLAILLAEAYGKASPASAGAFSLVGACLLPAALISNLQAFHSGQLSEHWDKIVLSLVLLSLSALAVALVNLQSKKLSRLEWTS